MKRIRNTADATTDTHYYTRFLEIVEKFSSKVLESPQASLKKNGLEYVKKQHYSTKKDKTDAARLITTTKIRGSVFGKAESRMPQSLEKMAVVTKRLTASNDLSLQIGLVEALLQLGSDWHEVTEPLRLAHEENYRIAMASRAIREGDDILLSVYVAFLRRQHRTALLEQSFADAKPYQVNFLLTHGAEMIAVRRAFERTVEVSADMLEVILAKSMVFEYHGWGMFDQNPRSRTIANPHCLLCLCNIFSTPGNHQSGLAYRNSIASLASGHVLGVLKILCHSWELWDEGLAKDLFARVLGYDDSKLTEDDITDLTEAILCLDKGNFASSTCTDPIAPTRDTWRVRRSREPKIKLDSILRDACSGTQLGVIKRLQNLSFPITTDTMEMALRQTQTCEGLLNIIPLKALLPHSALSSVLRHSYSIPNSVEKYRIMEEFTVRGSRCICIVDAIHSALASGFFESAYSLLKSVYSGERISPFLHLLAHYSWQRYSPECSQEGCQTPEHVKDLGWSDGAFPISLNIAITKGLSAYSKQTRLSDFDNKMFTFFLQKGVEYDENLEDCLISLCERGADTLILEITEHCKGVSEETFFLWLLAEEREKYLNTDRRLALSIKAVLKLPDSQQAKSLRRLGQFCVDRFNTISEWNEVLQHVHQAFQAENRKAFFLSVLTSYTQQTGFSDLEDSIKLEIMTQINWRIINHNAPECPLLESHTDATFALNKPMISALFNLSAPKAANWALKYSQKRYLFTEYFLAAVFDGFGLEEISTTEADAFLNNYFDIFLFSSQDDDFFPLGWLQKIVLRASSDIREEILYRVTETMRTGYVAGDSPLRLRRIFCWSKGPHPCPPPEVTQYLEKLGGLSKCLIDGTDFHSKHGEHSAFSNIVLSNTDVLYSFLRRVSQHRVGAAISTMIKVASSKPQTHYHVGSCATRVHIGIQMRLIRICFELPDATVLELLSDLWNSRIPHKSSGQLMSLILFLSRPSTSLIEKVWSLMASLCWTDWRKVNLEAIFCIFTAWMAKVLRNIYLESPWTIPPIFTWAIRNGFDFLVELLLDEKWDILIDETTPDSPLLFAVKHSISKNAIRALIKAGAPKNDGSLHEAARSLQMGTTALLLTAGHDPNFRAPRFGGRTVLAEICANANVQSGGDAIPVLSHLLNHGADPNISSGGMLPIFFALDNSSALLGDFLAITSFDAGSRVSEWLHINWGIYYSPISFLRGTCFQCGNRRDAPRCSENCHWHATRDQLVTRVTMLKEYEIAPRHLAIKGRQPPGAVGLPPDLQRLRNDRTDMTNGIGLRCHRCHNVVEDMCHSLDCRYTKRRVKPLKTIEEN